MLKLTESLLGTSARSLLFLFLAEIASIKHKRPRVLLPSFCCEAVYLAAYFSGCDIVFVDVCKRNFSLSLSDLEVKLSSKVDAVIVPHMFGYSAYSEEMSRLVHHYDSILWIDDACQTYLDSQYEPSTSYSKLDFRLSSFHSTKPLSGNIALFEPFTTCPFKLDIFQSAKSHVIYSDDLSVDHELRRLQANYFSYLVSSLRLGISNDVADPSVYSRFIDAYRYIIKPPQSRINAAVESYSRSFSHFYKLPNLIANFCDQLSSINSFFFTHPVATERLWRLPVICESAAQQQEISFKLRENNINVSNHYFSLEKLFDSNSGHLTCHVTNSITNRIFNIWFGSDSEVNTSISLLKSMV